jgi:hypothetical protein
MSKRLAQHCKLEATNLVFNNRQNDRQVADHFDLDHETFCN